MYMYKQAGMESMCVSYRNILSETHTKCYINYTMLLLAMKTLNL